MSKNYLISCLALVNLIIYAPSQSKFVQRFNQIKAKSCHETQEEETPEEMQEKNKLVQEFESAITEFIKARNKLMGAKKAADWITIWNTHYTQACGTKNNAYFRLMSLSLAELSTKERLAYSNMLRSTSK